jgi:single-stranded-DNA-specific exonuclease
MSKRWTIAELVSEEVKKKFPELDPVILQLLYNRGLTNQEEIDVYLGPDWSRDTYGPEMFSHMSEAVARVFDGLERGEVVTVYGDYDADGVCGATILITTLRDVCRAFGFDESVITWHIPHREKDGYGVSLETIEALHKEKQTKLLVTVDCGISNKSAIDQGKVLGMDTIICDHHAIPKKLPESAVLIHPQVPGETYPNKVLCGAGVAFKLASGLIHEARKRGAEFPEGHEKWLLDLVAIATVTDVMPLTGENRVLEKYGLLVLNKTKRLGLKKIIEIAGGKLGVLDTFSIGFQIGPRINAAGRMNHAVDALELLIEEDELRATELAMRLNETNQERRKASDQMYREALQEVGEIKGRKLIVVAREDWPAGLVGLVAGKLLSDFGVPVFVVGQKGETFVGSGRSIKGFDVTQALNVASEHLDKYGGHPQACGFSTTGHKRFELAVEAMRSFAQEQINSEMLIPEIYIDAKVSLEEVQWELVDLLQLFRPFGQANPKPVFLSEGLKVVSFSTVGKDGNHLKLCLQSFNGTIRHAIAFRFGYIAEDLTLGDKVDVVHEIDVNEWNGNRELQLRVVDINIR